MPSITADASPDTAGLAQPRAALGGYRVLDLTGEMGALCPRLFAGMGADVIKIEPPGGHSMRRRGPFLGGIPNPERSLYWMQLNAGKRSITLNLESADGRALFRRLAREMDVIVESLPVGELARLGLGYERLRVENPDLVLTAISAWGQDGPRAGEPGSDLIALAAGGLMYLCGDRDRPPVRPTVEQGYAQAGLQAAVASMVALWTRTQTGEGASIDVSMQECMICTMANNRLHWPASGLITHRAGGGRAFGDTPSRLIYQAADGFVGFMRRSEQHIALARWLDDEDLHFDFDVAEWQTMPHYGPGSPPADQVEQIEAALAGLFAGRQKHAIQTDAQARGLICAEVADPRDLVEGDHLRARGYFEDVSYPEFDRTVSVPGAPFRMTGTPWRTARAPRIGEHNVAVYSDELGLSRSELAALKGAGAI